MKDRWQPAALFGREKELAILKATLAPARAALVHRI